MTVDPRFEKIISHLEEEFAGIRTGRAAPTLVEHLKVKAYGSQTELRELASISVPEPKSLVIQPWDKAILSDIERAIQESSLGIQPINDGQVIRLIMPQLTEERRKGLVKVVHQKAEEAKISVRAVREKEMKEIKRLETEKQLSEDAAKIEQKKLQEEVDNVTKTLEELSTAKEQEVLTT